MDPKLPNSILVLLVLCSQGYSQTGDFYNCLRDTTRLPPLTVSRPTCSLSIETLRDLATVDGCASLPHYLPILTSLSNTQNLLYDGVSLFDAAHHCFNNITKEMCYSHNLCITCLVTGYESTLVSTLHDIEACRMFAYQELLGDLNERSKYELYKYMTLIEALYQVGYYSGSIIGTGATQKWPLTVARSAYDGYAQAYLEYACTDIHDCVKDLLLGCFHLREFFAAGPYLCFDEIKNRICSKYINEDAYRCNHVLEESVAVVYMEVCTNSEQEAQCADIFASILSIGELDSMDIKAIEGIISGRLYAHNKTVDALKLLNSAVERFSEDQNYVPSLLDDRDADVSLHDVGMRLLCSSSNGPTAEFIIIVNTLLDNNRSDDLHRFTSSQSNDSAGISLLNNLNGISKLLALAVIGRNTKIPLDYNFNASNLFTFLESSLPLTDYFSGNLSLDQAESDDVFASINIPASQICQNLIVIDDPTTVVVLPDITGGINGYDSEIVNPWPWCSNSTNDYYYYNYYGYYGYGYNYDTVLFSDCTYMAENINRECLTVVATSITRSVPALLSSTLPDNVEIASLILSSQIVTNASNVTQINVHPLSENATLRFKLNQRVNWQTSRPACHYWDGDAGVWSTDGVETEIISDTEVECIASHLTTFAVLIDHQGIQQLISGKERLALEITGYVGVSTSVICLVVTVILLLYMKKRMSSNPLYYMHLNLSISLLLALTLLITGLSTATGIRALCGVIAGMLHYLFLCVFCWMLAEGIMLLLSVVDLWGTVTKRWYLLLPLGWGLPAVIVAISAAIRYQQYGTAQYCWLSVDKGLIWAFIGPMIAICVVNTVILVITVSRVILVVAKKKKRSRKQRRHFQAVKSGILSVVILMPLLGTTWIVGVFAIAQDSTVFLWIFTVCNSLQGSAILFMQILRSREVKKRVIKQRSISSFISDTRLSIRRMKNGGSVSEIYPRGSITKGTRSVSPTVKETDVSMVTSIVEKPVFEESEVAAIENATLENGIQTINSKIV